MSELIQIQVTDGPTQERWRELRESVADELGTDPDELARWEIVREAAEAYCGGDALGNWRGDSR